MPRISMLLFQLTFMLVATPVSDVIAESVNSELDINISAILDSLLRDYDKRIRPRFGGVPVEVGVTMYILSVSSVSEVLMDFTMDFYFRQSWKDKRLSFEATGGIDMLTVGAELAQKIWVPDTFFVNEKSAYFHTATTSNSFLRISTHGDITRSIRLTVTASCPMDLQYFPMDRQLCNIEIESFGYTMSDIRYFWAKGENSIGISPEVQLPQFRVVGHRQHLKEINLSTGNYSRLACDIQLVRSMGYYLIQIYIPASLIVIISWVSFWLNRNATPARVALGVTTVLTMTTLMSSTNAALPKISYVKSIDVFLGTCFVMVFATLLEYATVGYLGKRIQMRKSRYQALQKLVEQRKQFVVEPNHTVSEAGSGAGGNEPLEVRFKMADPKEHKHPEKPKPENTGTGDAEGGGIITKNITSIYGVSPSDIDKYSRIVFPVCFVCFNLMYWIIYLHISDVLVEGLIPLKME